MALITDTPTLEALCRRLADADYITVDTEFMRETTFWPQLCLVQVAGPDEVRAIDAMAPGIDLGPLFELLADPKVLKVFHAARQDLEIFHHLDGRLPAPVFDTQIAAMVCGFGDSVGYETLIAKLTRARVDKSSRFTDWSMRPLRERQIAYALSDVTHLRPAYEKLRAMLAGNGREEWLEEEMAVLTSPETYLMDPDQAFRRIKSRSTNPRFLAVLRELAAWREREAKRRDQTRNRILREEPLLEIAHHTPSTPQELARTRGMGRKQAEGEVGAAILAALRRGLETPEAECPKPEIKPQLPRGLGAVSSLLKVLLKMTCDDAGVAQKLVASSDDLERIAAEGEGADVRALSGWRRQVFGDAALGLIRGDTALALRGRKLAVVDARPPADGAAD